MDLSLGVFNQTDKVAGVNLGPMLDYLTDWSQAKQFATNASLVDAAYYSSAQGARLDHLAYLKGEFQLADQLCLEELPYLHINRGAGDWHAPSYGASYSPDPIMFRQSQYHSNRGGLLGKLSSTFDLGDVKNQLEVGGWYKNTSKLMDNTLSINYGAKYLHVDADFKNNGNTPVNGKLAPIFADPTRPSLSAPTKGGFLP